MSALVVSFGLVVGMVIGMFPPADASVFGIGTGGLSLLGGLPASPFGSGLCSGGAVSCGPFNDQPNMESLSAHVIAGLAWVSGLVWHSASDLLAGLARVWDDSNLPADVVAYVQGLEQQVISSGGVFDPGTPPSDIGTLWSDLEGPPVSLPVNTWSVAGSPESLPDTTESEASDVFGAGTSVLLSPAVSDPWNDGNGTVYSWLTGCWNGGVDGMPGTGPACYSGAGVTLAALHPTGSEASLVLSYIGNPADGVYISYTGTDGSQHVCGFSPGQMTAIGSDGFTDASGSYSEVYVVSVAALVGAICPQAPEVGPNWSDPITLTVGNFAEYANYQGTSTDTFELGVVGWGLTNSSCSAPTSCPVDVQADGGAGFLPSPGFTLGPGVSSPAVPAGQQVAAPLDPTDLDGANVGQVVSVKTVAGGAAPMDTNTPSTVSIVGPLLTGIQNLFEVDTQEQVSLEQQVQSLEGTASGVFPFAWWSSFLTTFDSFFSGAGSTCPDISWTYTLGAASFGTQTIPLCDAFGVMATVRTISSFVIYGFLLIWGFLEVRSWFRSGGTD